MRGSIERRGPRRWFVTYYDDTDRKRGKSFQLKCDAVVFLATTQVAQLRGDWVDPKAGRVTVAEYGTEWLRLRHIRPTTRERYAGYLRYVNRLGTVPLSTLTPSMIEQWQLGLLDDLAVSTAGTIRGVFASMLKTAVRDRIIPRTPMEGVKAPKPVRKLIVPLPLSTVLSIRDSMIGRYRAAIDVGAGCGLRRGETFGLTADRVDFLRKVLTVDRGLIQLAGQAPRFGPPKTDASVRVVPMPDFVVASLAAHLAEFPAGPDGLIFTTQLGNPVRRSTFLPAWRRSGAPAGSRFHDLRHFYASMLIASGSSVKVVQARLGHATAAETLDTYAHLWPDDDNSTRRALDEAFAVPKYTESPLEAGTQ